MAENDRGAQPPPGFSQPEWLYSREGNKHQRPEVVANVCLNSYLDIDHFKIHDHSDIPLVLCGGGPSLKDNVDLIGFYQDQGARVVCTNDTHVFLKANGIEPFCWAYGEVQYLPDDHRWFKNHNDTPLYIASHCNHEVVKRLKDENTVMWHFAGFELANQAIGQFYPGEPAFWGSAVPLLRFLNVCVSGWKMKNIHVFGADSSYRNGKHHAYEAYVPGLKEVPIWAYGREFISNPHLVRQARDFCDILDAYAKMRPEVKVTVYGDGLLPHLAKNYTRSDHSVSDTRWINIRGESWT